MLDTTVFNHLVTRVDIASLRQCGALFVTHIQFGELQATRCVQRREELLEIFKQINPSRVPTESAVWGVSEWGESKWEPDDGIFGQMLASLNGRNANKANNANDILIAVTALRNAWTLVTDDRALGETLQEFGGVAVGLREFLARTA